MRWEWEIHVLMPSGDTEYYQCWYRGEAMLSPKRSDAFTFPTIDDAAEEYRRLSESEPYLNFSIEAVQRTGTPYSIPDPVEPPALRSAVVNVTEHA